MDLEHYLHWLHLEPILYTILTRSPSWLCRLSVQASFPCGMHQHRHPLDVRQQYR
jgi:hypothetical protein